MRTVKTDRTSGTDTSRWPRASLGEFILSYRNGFGRRPRGIESGPIVLRIADVSGGHVDLSDSRRVDMRANELTTYSLKPNDLLFIRVNGSRHLAGRCILIGETPETLAFNDHLIRVRLTHDLDPAYVCLACQSSEVREGLIAAASTSAGQFTVNQQAISSISLPIPPLAEQKRIAAALREQLDAAARMRAAAAAQTTSIARAESAMARTAFKTAEVIGAERVALGALCAIKAPLVDPRLAEYRRLPHVSGENIESGTGRLLEVHSAVEDGMISGKYLFEAGSVLYSKLRPYLRKATVADFRGLCSADMYPLRPLGDKLDALFLKWLLLSDEFTVYADGESRRARMPKLNREQLFSWVAPVPSITDQRRIAETLQRRIDAAWALRSMMDNQATNMGRLPATLLRPAFSW